MFKPALLIGTLVLFTTLSPAAVLYSTFAPADTYNTGVVDEIGFGTANGNAGLQWADPFTVSSTGQVQQYRVAMASFAGMPPPSSPFGPEPPLPIHSLKTIFPSQSPISPAKS